VGRAGSPSACRVRVRTDEFPVIFAGTFGGRDHCDFGPAATEWPFAGASDRYTVDVAGSFDDDVVGRD
jgi:hypothetical protein